MIPHADRADPLFSSLCLPSHSLFFLSSRLVEHLCTFPPYFPAKFLVSFPLFCLPSLTPSFSPLLLLPFFFFSPSPLFLLISSFPHLPLSFIFSVPHPSLFLPHPCRLAQFSFSFLRSRRQTRVIRVVLFFSSKFRSRSTLPEHHLSLHCVLVFLPPLSELNHYLAVSVVLHCLFFSLLLLSLVSLVFLGSVLSACVRVSLPYSFFLSLSISPATLAYLLCLSAHL